MSYYYSKILKNTSFEEAIILVTKELEKEGFGILTEIDIKETLKKKLNVDFKKYKILGACNPFLAYKALKSENKIGVLLPCNIVIEEHDNGEIEVSAVDPVVTMRTIKNKSLIAIKCEVQEKLNKAIKNL